MANAACYILFKDSRSHVFYHEKGLDLGTLSKGMKASMYDLVRLSNLFPCEYIY